MAWEMLCQAVPDRHHGFHLLTFVTVNAQHEPDARSVVLRRVDVARRAIYFHTDVRAPKLEHIAANPTVAILVYDERTRVQLRMKGNAGLGDATTTQVQWEQATLSSKRCYLAPYAPGVATLRHDPNLPANLKGANPDEAETAPARVNFAVVETRMQRVEVLHLASSGHVRAAFSYGPDGHFGASTFLTA